MGENSPFNRHILKVIRTIVRQRALLAAIKAGNKEDVYEHHKFMYTKLNYLFILNYFNFIKCLISLSTFRNFYIKLCLFKT